MARHFLLLLFVACIARLNAQIIPATEESADDQGKSDGTIDEIIAQAANSSSQFEFFNNEKGSGMVKIEYDMVFSAKEYAEMQRLSNKTESTGRKRRTAGIYSGVAGGRRWTNNIVPYQVAPYIFSKSQINEILAAIKDWGRYTCLKFKLQNTGNRLYFQSGGGCSSRVGMVGGAQPVTLGAGCRYKGVAIHEMGHALGLYHEQSRPDRDNYVRIINKNIPQSLRYNFQKHTWKSILKLNIPYDYTSIMHYGKTAFSSNGAVTIQTVDPKYQNVIGNRKSLSFKDIKTINVMYNCKRHKPGCKKRDTECPNGGFVGKDCRCWCPGGSLSFPTRYCSASGGTKPKPTKPVVKKPVKKPIKKRPVTQTACSNRNTKCSAWARRGECTSSHAAYMLAYCRKACGWCGRQVIIQNTCRDLHYSCPAWVRLGYCYGVYATYTRANCKRSCNACGASDEPICSNTNDNCEYWAKNGECTRNPNYMLSECKLACGKCSLSDNVSVKTTTQRPANCIDRNQHCSFWAGTGFCSKNKSYMMVHCKASCNFC